LAENPRATMTWVCHKDHHSAARALLHPVVASRVAHMGWMRHEDLATVFDTHGVFLFPTLAEGFGRVALEAMSRGMCVISSNCCGMRDYIQDGVDGQLCPVGDVDTFSRVALRLQASVAAAERLSSASYAKAQSFTWRRSAAELAEFLTCLKQQSRN
jgi:glycosyltransferase involved in cell wall biosynthesis